MYLSKTSANLNPRGQQPQENLQKTTVRSFEGGLNVTDTDLNMSPKYAKTLDNIERDLDGSLAIRPGTQLFSDQIADTTNIVNCYYFNDFIITVHTSGRVFKVAGDGTATELLIGGAAPWTSGSVEVNFTIFNSDLIICNGRDKPVIIHGKVADPNYMLVRFLVDLGGGTNVNTPVGKYVIAHSQYTCISGIAAAASTICISAKGTSGTFFGDPPPNDAVTIDLGPRVSLGSSTITGMVAYRDKLLVAFERGILPLNLGVYTGSPSVHTPSDDGFIEEFGCLTHRSLVSVGDDTFYCDNVGVNSISRVNIFNTLRPVRASHLIDPLITEMVQPLSRAQISQYVFAVYDLRHFRYMLFVPMFDIDGTTVLETVVFSYSNIPSLKIQAWARLRGWVWQSACRTSLQNVIFAQGYKLYAYSFDDNENSIDFVGDSTINGGAGVPVTFTWEMPWTDLKRRMDIKYLRYIAADTQGSGNFNMRGYVDNILSDPLLSIDFVGGGTGGYGSGPYGSTPYGGGRRTVDERLFAFVSKFKLLKLVLSGTTKKKLRFISISIAYLHGSIRR